MKKTLVHIILIAGIVLGVSGTVLAFLTGKDLLPKCKRLYSNITAKIKK